MHRLKVTDNGQTWFYGADTVHIRRFTDDYTPQDGPLKLQDGGETREFLIIGTEWMEEEALQRLGFQYKLLPSGHYSLDPRLTWVRDNLL